MRRRWGVGADADERAAALVENGVDALVIDTAHGHSKLVLETVEKFKVRYGSRVDILAGNVATAEGTKALIDAGGGCCQGRYGPGVDLHNQGGGRHWRT